MHLAIGDRVTVLLAGKRQTGHIQALSDGRVMVVFATRVPVEKNPKGRPQELSTWAWVLRDDVKGKHE